MALLIIILLLSVTLIAINPSIVIALNASINEPGNNTGFGGLSAESTDIAEANNKTDLMMDRYLVTTQASEVYLRNQQTLQRQIIKLI